MTRTREEITKRIETLENRRFYLNMKDRWDRNDWKTIREWDRELFALNQELKAMEEEVNN